MSGRAGGVSFCSEESASVSISVSWMDSREVGRLSGKAREGLSSCGRPSREGLSSCWKNEFIDMKEACAGVNEMRESIGLSAGSVGGREEVNDRMNEYSHPHQREARSLMGQCTEGCREVAFGWNHRVFLLVPVEYQHTPPQEEDSLRKEIIQYLVSTSQLYTYRGVLLGDIVE